MFPSLDPTTQQLVTFKLKVQLGANGFQPSDDKNDTPEVGARVTPVDGY